MCVQLIRSIARKDETELNTNENSDSSTPKNG